VLLSRLSPRLTTLVLFWIKDLLMLSDVNTSVARDDWNNYLNIFNKPLKILVKQPLNMFIFFGVLWGGLIMYPTWKQVLWALSWLIMLGFSFCRFFTKCCYLLFVFAILFGFVRAYKKFGSPGSSLSCDESIFCCTWLLGVKCASSWHTYTGVHSRRLPDNKITRMSVKITRSVPKSYAWLWKSVI
jgi:hypothetical protein